MSLNPKIWMLSTIRHTHSHFENIPFQILSFIFETSSEFESPIVKFNCSFAKEDFYGFFVSCQMVSRALNSYYCAKGPDRE